MIIIKKLLIVFLVLFTLITLTSHTSLALEVKGHTEKDTKILVNNKVYNTDDGNFVIDNLKKGEYLFEFYNDDFKNKKMFITLKENKNLDYISLEPKPAYFKGYIFNHKREPLENVKVKIKELNKTTTTNLKGEFSFDNIPYRQKPYKIIIEHNNYKKRIAEYYSSFNRVMYIMEKLEPKKSKMIFDLPIGTKLDINNKSFRVDKKPFIVNNLKSDNYIVKAKHKNYNNNQINVNLDINDKKNLKDFSLKTIPAKLKIKTIPNTTIKLNEKSFTTNREGILKKDINPDKYNIIFNKKGYEKKEISKEIKSNKIVNLNINLERKKYITNSFTEDSWIGSYFLNNNFSDNYYPFYEIRKLNKDGDNLENRIKTIIADYIIVNGLEIVSNINFNTVENTTDLLDKLEVLEIKGYPVKEELFIISQLKKEVNQKILFIEEEFSYNFSHITLNKNNNTNNNSHSLNNLTKLFENNKLNRTMQTVNEIEKSSINNQIISNIYSKSLNELKKYKDTPLISINGEGDIVKKNINAFTVNLNDLKEMQNFLNFFPERRGSYENYYKWQEIN